jgi:murein L,D-transpeptidase YcbB/YkuD
MKRSYYLAIALSVIIITATFFTYQFLAYRKDLSDKIRNKIESLDSTHTIDGKLIYQPDMIAKLYEKNKDLLTAKWNKRENIDQLLAFIRNAQQEGLNPEDYHLTTIENLATSIANTKNASIDEIAQLELILTDAFFLLSSHLASGKTDQKTIDPNWNAAKREFKSDWNTFIDSTLKLGKVNETLHQLSPNHQQYRNLKKALATYQNYEKVGGWEPFTTNIKKLEKGVTHPDVALLRKRLSFGLDSIKPDSLDVNYFDQTLHNHVVIFQTRNGLHNDGVIGKKTVETLNISVQERVATIEANLERWRWLSNDLGETHILVNIANFDLQLIQNGKSIFSTEVIVGKPYRETPVFSSFMKYIVFNPDWVVPPTIMSKDVVPAVIANPNYLVEKNMEIITMNGVNVDPTTIDWTSAAKRGFPYMIRQKPGANNALGRIKFVFPNQENIYIHDTPSRGLFAQSERNFSSGCIRINKPLELASILLRENSDWSTERISQVIKEGTSRTVLLAKPLPVHLIYMTAWADDDGVAYFRRDIYNRDQPLLMALKKHHEPVAKSK